MEYRGENSLSTSSFKTFLQGLAVFAVLVIIFEGAVMSIPEEIVVDVAQQSGMRIKNDRAFNPGDLDVVILGDCFFFAGVNPAILDEQLGSRSFNFATNRAQTYMMSYVLLKNILQQAPHHPKLIILGVHATSLYYPLTMDMDVLRQTILPYFSVSADLLNELPFSLRMQTIWHHMLTRIPSLKKQYLLRGNWPQLIAHFDRSNHTRMEQSLAENRGFFNEDLVPHQAKIPINFYLPVRDMTIQSYNGRYIKKILELARENGIKVVLVTNSYREDFMQYMNYNIQFDLEYFEGLQRAYPNVIAVLDMHNTVTDFDRYADITHLDGQGAVMFTEDLAQKLKQLHW